MRAMRPPKLVPQVRLNAPLRRPGKVEVLYFYTAYDRPSMYQDPKPLVLRPGQVIVDTMFGKVVIEENGEASDRSLGG